MQNYFQSISFFSDISQEDQQNLSDFCQLQSIERGDVLFKEGEEPQALYIIISGELGVYKEAGMKKVAVLGKGDIVGEMAFFYKKPPRRNATVIAENPTKLITVLHFGIDRLLQKYPTLHKDFMNIIHDRSDKNKEV